MESTIANAFLLLAVGMITVFVILSLVIGTGTLLIYITNKMYKQPQNQSNKISNETVAVLTAVVNQVTGNSGNIDSIEKY